jgi:hypothetical protein
MSKMVKAIEYIEDRVELLAETEKRMIERATGLVMPGDNVRFIALDHAIDCLQMAIRERRLTKRGVVVARSAIRKLRTRLEGR